MENYFRAHFFPLLNQINDLEPWSFLPLAFQTQQHVHVYKQMNYSSCHVNIKIQVSSSANSHACKTSFEIDVTKSFHEQSTKHKKYQSAVPSKPLTVA